MENTVSNRNYASIVYLHCRLSHDKDFRRILPWLFAFLRAPRRHHMFTCTYDHSFRNRMAYSIHTYMAPTETTDKINCMNNIANYRSSLSSIATLFRISRSYVTENSKDNIRGNLGEIVTSRRGFSSTF